MSFDDNARTWDTDRRIHRAKIIANEIKNAFKNISLDSALEFGCGTGLISFNLVDVFKEITLVDSSKVMIEILNNKISHYNVKNMIPLNLDIIYSDIMDSKFNIIYSSMVLHHIDNTELVISKFYHYLNNDGYICIVDLDTVDPIFHKNELNAHHGFNQNELKSILSFVGFKEICSKTFYYGKKVVNGENIDYSLFIMIARK